MGLEMNMLHETRPEMRMDSIKKKASIRGILIMAFLSMTVIPILIIGLFSYFNILATLTDKVSQYSISGLAQTVVNVQLKLAEFENISVRLFINKEFKNTLVAYSSAMDHRVELQKKAEIEAYFNEYMISNPDVFAFMFLSDINPSRTVVVSKDYFSDFMDLTHHLKNTTSYQNIRRAGGGIVWSTSIKSKLNHYVVLGRQIKDVVTGESIGVLAIFVDEEQIDRLTNLNVYNQINISFSNIENYNLVVDSYGEIISTPFKEDIGKPITKIMKDSKPLQKFFNASASNRDYGSEVNQGSYITEVSHKQTLVTYKTIGSKIGVGGKSGWHLVCFTPTSYLYAGAQKIYIMMACIAGLFIVLSVALAMLMSKFINKTQ